MATIPYDLQRGAARFKDECWLLDAVIRVIGPEWDPPHLPCLVMVNGMDGAKEQTQAASADRFLRRGFACLCLDGPGQGTSLTREIWYHPDSYGEGGDVHRSANARSIRLGPPAFAYVADWVIARAHGRPASSEYCVADATGQFPHPRHAGHQRHRVRARRAPARPPTRRVVGSARRIGPARAPRRRAHGTVHRSRAVRRSV